jgi:hypothetical protein
VAEAFDSARNGPLLAAFLVALGLLSDKDSHGRPADPLFNDTLHIRAVCLGNLLMLYAVVTTSVLPLGAAFIEAPVGITSRIFFARANGRVCLFDSFGFLVRANGRVCLFDFLVRANGRVCLFYSVVFILRI